MLMLLMTILRGTFGGLVRRSCRGSCHCFFLQAPSLTLFGVCCRDSLFEGLCILRFIHHFDCWFRKSSEIMEDVTVEPESSSPEAAQTEAGFSPAWNMQHQKHHMTSPMGMGHRVTWSCYFDTHWKLWRSCCLYQVQAILEARQILRQHIPRRVHVASIILWWQMPAGKWILLWGRRLQKRTSKSEG